MPVEDESRAHPPRIQPRQVVYVDYPDHLARIRDLNLYGAYIEDPRPFSVGHVYRVRLWLDEEVTVTAKAIVRRSEPGSGLAVEFIEMSEEDRAHLRDFLGASDRAEGQKSR